MYASVHIENKVTIEEVLKLLLDNLLTSEMTTTIATITTEPPAGYKPPQLLTWVSVDDPANSEAPANTSKRYIIDNEGNVFTLTVTAVADPHGKYYSIVTAKSVAAYTAEEYSIFNTTTRLSDLPKHLRSGEHGYSYARSGGRHLSESTVGHALSETVRDVAMAVLPHGEGEDPKGYFMTNADSEVETGRLVAKMPPYSDCGAYALVNQYGAMVGYKVIVSHDLNYRTILESIIASAGLDTDNDMGYPHGYADCSAAVSTYLLDKLCLSFSEASFAYVTTPNNEVYALSAGKNKQPYATGAPTSTVCAIRVAPSVYLGEKIEPTVAHGNVPISEDMRHSYYGRNIVRAVDALLTPIS